MVNALMCDLVFPYSFYFWWLKTLHYWKKLLPFTFFCIFHLFCLSTCILHNFFLTIVWFTNTLFGYTMLLLKPSTEFFILVIVFLFLELVFVFFQILYFSLYSFSFRFFLFLICYFIILICVWNSNMSSFCSFFFSIKSSDLHTLCLFLYMPTYLWQVLMPMIGAFLSRNSGRFLVGNKANQKTVGQYCSDDARKNCQPSQNIFQILKQDNSILRYRKAKTIHYQQANNIRNVKDILQAKERWH